MRRKASLVKAYAEGIPRTALEDWKKAVEKVVRKKSGIYTLSKGKKLHYVGIASELPSRLKEHLRDHLKESWDRFSFYRIPRSYLKQIEAILVRIARPKGNRQKGTFGRGRNVRKKLIKEIQRAAVAGFEG